MLRNLTLASSPFRAYGPTFRREFPRQILLDLLPDLSRLPVPLLRLAHASLAAQPRPAPTPRCTTLPPPPNLTEPRSSPVQSNPVSSRSEQHMISSQFLGTTTRSSAILIPQHLYTLRSRLDPR